MKRKILALSALALGTVAIVGLYGAKTISAQGGRDHPFVQRLAERFGLNEDEVETFFEEEKEAHRQEKQAKFEEYLDQAVADGKITEEQKQAILAKHEEHQAEMEALKAELKDLSPEERKAKMQELKQEMEQWAEENGINLEEIMPEKGFKRGKGKGFRYMK